MGLALRQLLSQFPQSLLGVLLAFAGIGLAVAGSKPRLEDSEAKYTTIVATAAATLVFKTGWGCAIGVVVALFNGGFTHVVEYLQRKCGKGSGKPRAVDSASEGSQELSDCPDRNRERKESAGEADLNGQPLSLA